MKWRFSVLGPLALALCVFALPLHAQTSDTATKPAAHHQWYDMRQEVRITGMVSSVEKTPARGTESLPGSHLIVETMTGKVNASLGRFALKGKSTFSVASGQQVQMIGVMKTIKERQVFVVREIQVNNHSYALRNERGFENAALAHKGATKSEAKGGQL